MKLTFTLVVVALALLLTGAAPGSAPVQLTSDEMLAAYKLWRTATDRFADIAERSGSVGTAMWLYSSSGLVEEAISGRTGVDDEMLGRMAQQIASEALRRMDEAERQY